LFSDPAGFCLPMQFIFPAANSSIAAGVFVAGHGVFLKIVVTPGEPGNNSHALHSEHRSTFLCY
jgi:hypothetical protein